MFEPDQRTRPAMRTGAGFGPDQAQRQALEELQHLAAATLTAQDSAALRISTVQLENRFRQINPECGNVTHGGLPLWAVSQHPTWHIAMPEAGAIHFIHGIPGALLDISASVISSRIASSVSFALNSGICVCLYVISDRFFRHAIYINNNCANAP